jgi:hypothetical protein
VEPCSCPWVVHIVTITATTTIGWGMVRVGVRDLRMAIVVMVVVVVVMMIVCGVVCGLLFVTFLLVVVMVMVVTIRISE